MLRVLEQAFFVGHSGGDDVGTSLDGTPGKIEGGSFGQDFPLTFISTKPDGQCNAQTTVSILTLKLALGIALIHFFFCFSFWETIHRYFVTFQFLRRIVRIACMNTIFLSHI